MNNGYEKIVVAFTDSTRKKKIIRVNPYSRPKMPQAIIYSPVMN
jgi:hypothetical protein